MSAASLARSNARRPARAVLVVTCIVGAAVMLENCNAQPRDSKVSLAGALGIAPADVRTACDIRFESSATLGGAHVGLYARAGETRAAALLYAADSSVVGAPVDLLPASSLEVIGVVDLAGAPRALDLQGVACPERPLSLAGFAAPALLVRTQDRSMDVDDTLLLVSLSAAPAVRWSEVVRSVAGNGEGYDTVSLRFERGRTAGMLDIVAVQHALPARGAAEFRPGPPLTTRFEPANGVYERVD
jgi:hypothetical protein